MQYYYNCLFLCIPVVRKTFVGLRCKFHTQWHKTLSIQLIWLNSDGLCPSYQHFGFWVPCKLIAIWMYMLIKFVIVYNLLLNEMPNVVTKKSLYFLFFILFYCQRLFLHSRFNSTYACGLKRALQRWEYIGKMCLVITKIMLQCK